MIRVDKGAMWNLLRLNGIGGRLLQGVNSLYVGSKACVRVGNKVSEWFPVRVGLRQGCVMLLWLFNLYTDGVVYSNLFTLAVSPSLGGS